jgi:methyl-accepting chemotaxis protein
MIARSGVIRRAWVVARRFVANAAIRANQYGSVLVPADGRKMRGEIMDLDEAVGKHIEWKVKLRSSIVKKELVDAATIRRDNCCVLGKWLHGEGKNLHGNKSSFGPLVTRHAEFHRCAGNVADAINAKKYDQATVMLEGNSEFGVASFAVAAAIKALIKEV